MIFDCVSKLSQGRLVRDGQFCEFSKASRNAIGIRQIAQRTKSVSKVFRRLPRKLSQTVGRLLLRTFRTVEQPHHCPVDVHLGAPEPGDPSSFKLGSRLYARIGHRIAKARRKNACHVTKILAICGNGQVANLLTRDDT